MTPLKVDGFDDEIVVMISSGYPFIALTENGRVFSAYCQRYHMPYENYLYHKKEPKLIELNDMSISKITLRLLLSTDGDIYKFVDNNYGKIENGNKKYQSKPVRISHKNKFVDIECSKYINIALSTDHIFYVWGECGDNSILTPTEKNLKSIHQILSHYRELGYLKHNEIIHFENQFFRNGFFEQKFNKIAELEKGNFS